MVILVTLVINQPRQLMVNLKQVLQINQMMKLTRNLILMTRLKTNVIHMKWHVKYSLTVYQKKQMNENYKQIL